MEISYKNGSIFYEVTGNGKPVVFLHGFLEDHTMWGAITSELSINNRVIAIDLLGCGNTDVFEETHTMEMMAEAVHFVLEHLTIAHASFVGHSMGGYVALAFAEMFPEKVEKLCLLTSTPEADSDERRNNRDRAIHAVTQNKGSFVRWSIENLFDPKNRNSLREEIEHAKQQALKTSTEGIVAALKGMKIRKDRTRIFKGLDTNKLMIIGKHDLVLDASDLTALALKLGIPVKVLDGGHMLHIENREEHNKIIKNFVDN